MQKKKNNPIERNMVKGRKWAVFWKGYVNGQRTHVKVLSVLECEICKLNK